MKLIIVGVTEGEEQIALNSYPITDSGRAIARLTELLEGMLACHLTNDLHTLAHSNDRASRIEARSNVNRLRERHNSAIRRIELRDPNGDWAINIGAVNVSYGILEV